MTDNKKAIYFTGGVILVFLLVGAGIWIGSRYFYKLPTKTASLAAAGNTSSGPSGSDINVISGSSASNLGQLSTTGSAGTPTTPNQNGNSQASPAQTISPATFAQYNKYATNSSALFGEINVGNGNSLSANQKATVTYKGWLTNGTLFDQSQANSSGQLEPIVFTVGAHQVIPGLEQGIIGMKVGGSRLVIIPPALGYGTTGKGSIPGGAVLIFQVNLLDAQ